MPITDSISPVKSDDIGRPVGTYRVELLDRHTGRIKERQDVSNYISPLLLQRMRWLQMMQFHANNRYVHLGDALHEFPRDVYDHPLATAPTMPMEFIAGLSSDLAENSSSSWGTGFVEAYASRWKTTIPAAGARGQINEAQSEMTIDGSKIVFDFNEDQGNGSINSLAICRLAQPKFGYTVPSLALRTGYAARREGLNGGLIDGNYVQVLGFEPDMSVMYVVDGSSAVIQEWDMVTNAAAVDDMGLVDQSPLTLSDIIYTSPALSTSFQWYTSTGSSINYNYYQSSPALVRDGNTYYIAHGDRSGDLVVGSWNRTTGAKNWNNEYLNSGSTFVNGVYGLVLLGGKLYATVSSNNAATTGAAYGIQRIDPTTGAAEAVLPFGSDTKGNTILSLGGLTTDGTDLYVTTSHGLLKMTTAGAIVENYGSPVSSNWVETGLAPWATSTNYQQVTNPCGDRDEFGMVQGPLTTTYDSFRGDSPDILTGDPTIHCDTTGKLWCRPGYTGSGTSPIYLRALDGGNVFSRSVLDTTVNKTNSSTMKWTYEITFPSEWRTPSAHPLPPT